MSGRDNATAHDCIAHATFLAWAKGIEGISEQWDSHDRYKLVPDRLDEAHSLFKRGVAMDDHYILGHTLFGKFRESHTPEGLNTAPSALSSLHGQIVHLAPPHRPSPPPLPTSPLPTSPLETPPTP